MPSGSIGLKTLTENSITRNSCWKQPAIGQQCSSQKKMKMMYKSKKRPGKHPPSWKTVRRYEATQDGGNCGVWKEEIPFKTM
jgi:hypothetical protein